MASDKYSIKRILLFTMTAFVFTGLFFPLTSNYKPTFCFFFLLMGIINSGILTVTGPALIRFFGIEVTKRLLPLKTTAIYVSIILSPIFIFLSLKILSFDIVFALIALASTFSIYKIYLMREDYPVY
jgi:MFS family permease